MSKKVFFKVGVALIFVAAAVVWLLSVLMPDQFGNINLSWVIAVACGLLGVMFILRAFFDKTLTFVKKFYVLVGAALLVAAVLALVGTLIENKLALPIIAIVITVCALLSILAVGGKKWDTADNEKVGYKTYRERKAEEEKENEKK